MDTSEESIFDHALSRQTSEEREAYLLQACAGQPDLLNSVRSLLDAYPLGAILEQTVAIAPAGQVIAALNLNGAIVGPYLIRELIGHGRMGSVYRAQQLTPVRRMVAVKIIRAGLNTQDVVRRFHQEQQTLAMMDHPNIARVLDAGATESGVPYFVMELVQGDAILNYCEKNQVSVRDRLLLFSDCCNAIQHAHQKGIIHRDIKPSNVLVTLQNGLPVVKVIDFGIAKALREADGEQTAGGRTLVNRIGAIRVTNWRPARFPGSVVPQK